MFVRRRNAGIITTIGVAALVAGGSGGAVAAQAAGAHETAAAAAAVPVVTVHMSDQAIKLSGGGTTSANGQTTMHAGRVMFKVVTKSGDHVFQIVRFRHGYTPQQAQQDIPKAFSGDTDAIRRVDEGIAWRGGAEAKPQQPGQMVVTLNAGQYYLIDQNGNAVAPLQVTGTAPKRAAVPSAATYTAYSYGWGVSKSLPAKGMVRVHNQADQPHFLVLQRVKESTTNKAVRQFIKSGSEKNPSWAMKASAESGVLSQTKSQLVSYDLPAGKYLLACFWPDLDTGMPHVMMGMWKLVRLS